MTRWPSGQSNLSLVGLRPQNRFLVAGTFLAARQGRNRGRQRFLDGSVPIQRTSTAWVHSAAAICTGWKKSKALISYSAQDCHSLYKVAAMAWLSRGRGFGLQRHHKNDHVRGLERRAKSAWLQMVATDDAEDLDGPCGFLRGEDVTPLVSTPGA